MLLTTLTTAQSLEEADALHITRQMEVCSHFFPGEKSVALPFAGGVAGLTLPSFGRKLNHVVGFGMLPVSSGEFAAVEETYVKLGMEMEIDLCPLADASALEVLAERKYSVGAFINSYVKVLTDEDFLEVKVQGIEVSRVSAEEEHEFPAIMIAGYKDGGRPEQLLETLGRIAVSRADTSLYFATVDGKIAGSASLAFIETSKGGVAYLYMDSTLPEYRGRGIQRALLRARLKDARKAGYEIASVGARPGNGSCRNIERAGFSLAYTKTIFVKRRA